MPQVRTFWDSISVGKIKVYTNPEGSQVGRYWPHADMLPKNFDQAPIVKAHNFFVGGNVHPKVVLASHFDGHTETSFNHCQETQQLYDHSLHR